MEVITFELQAFKKLEANIDTLAKFVTAQLGKIEEQSGDGWVDSFEVCKFLKISDKTLQRLRVANTVSYSKIRGKNYYKISEIQRLMDENIIRSSGEHLQNLINNHQLQIRKKTHCQNGQVTVWRLCSL